MSDKQQDFGQMPIDNADLRKRAEEQARNMEPIALSAHPPEEIQRMFHELQVRQIELEMQNEELRKAQARIEVGRKRYSDHFDLAPVGFCAISDKGLILEINLTAATLLGVARSALVHQPISRFIFKNDEDIFNLHRKRLFETGEPQECELRLVKPEGALFWANLRGTAAQAEDGAPICRVVLSDITDRKRNEDELRIARELSKRIIEDGPMAITLVDREGKIVFANRHAERLFGLEKSDIEALTYNAPDWLITDIDGSPFPDERLPFHRVMSTGQAVYDIQHAITLPDDTRKILSINGAPLHDEQGRIDRVVFAIQDITDRKQAEESLKQIEWMLSRKPDSYIELQTENHDQGYGDLTELNRDGMILKSIGRERLKSFVTEYLELLGSSSAIYERNGDYAFGIFASGWCRMMDSASRNLCDTPDNVEALNSGRWLCHESCWTDCSKAAMTKRTQVDIECCGGIRLYAEPIFAGENVIGAINFGYGDPPHDPEKLKRLADLFHLDYDDLLRKATAYDSRPPYIIEMAKKRLHSTAKLIGSMVETHQAMEALRENESILNMTGQMAKIGGWELYSETMQVTWTDETYRIHEMPERIKPPLEDAIHFWHPEDQPILRKAIQQALDNAIPYDLELRFITAKGRSLHARTKCNPVLRDGKVVKLQGFIQDITERKQAEEHLQKFKQIVSSTSEGIALLDKNYCYVIVNKAYETFSGKKKEALVGLTVAEYLGERVFYEQIKPQFDRCLHGETMQFQDWFEYPTLGKRFVEVTYFPYVNTQGEFSGVVANTRDITERKKAEEALRESEARFQKMLSVVPDMISIHDPDMNILYSNWQGFASVPPQNRVINTKCYKTYRNLDHICPDCKAKTILETRRAFQEDIELPDGTWIDLRVLPLLDENGSVNMFMEWVRDITIQKKETEERKRLQEQLSQSQKMESVGRLAGGIAHDFNNMLGVIIGHAEMALEQVPTGEPLHADLEEIQKAAQRSANLTRQLLAFARKQTVSPKVLNLNDTVKSMLTMLIRLIGEDIDLVWKPGHELWPMKMDPAQIDHILANLCVNARDAIAGVGKITIETGNTTFDSDYCARNAGFVPGDYVLLAVSDDGCGMDAETISHLFEPFYTTKEVGKGTGLGLASIYGAVKQNHGFINVYSEPDHGTRFTIYLPRYATEAVLETEGCQPLAPERGSETILLVEDEPTILKMTTMMLERLGYTVIAAPSPDEAIRLAGEYPGHINLLMTDVVMPGMNGRDLATNLLPFYPDIRLLYMSGYTANVIAHHGVLDEGVHFIQKPFSMKDLGAKIREALENG